MADTSDERDQLARAAADAMWAGDSASRGLGMHREHIASGQATLSMTVRPDMTNGLDICHGGYIFTLADSAMAFASNSHNVRAAAQYCAVTFLSPAAEGDTLTAVASEQGLHGRTGIYDVTVTNQDGKVIAEFRGHTRTIGGEHVDIPNHKE